MAKKHQDEVMEMMNYEYDCGHKAVYVAEDVLHLREEPNWGCKECDEGETVVDSWMTHRAI
jgi:hypothetical protein